MGLLDRIRRTDKAPLALPAGSVVISESQAAAVAQNPSSGTTAQPLERNPLDYTVPFAPGRPLIPGLINPARDEGRATPRRSEFPVAWNIQVQEQRTVPFRLLRDMADNTDIVRKCIETVKAVIAGMEYDIVLSNDAVERVMSESGGTGHAAAAKEAREKLVPEITRVKDFWAMPDRINGMNFQEWVMCCLEEMLVVDALSIYPNQTLDNKALHSLEILDGTTIKPLLDDRGARPTPPHAAYQQILWGFPRGEFTASADADGEFTMDDLVYAPRVRRPFTPYGFSPVERALPMIDLYLKRMQWLRTEFTDGVIPDVFVETDATYGNNPELLSGYERVFNDSLAGITEQRRRAKLLPNGMHPIFPPGLDTKYKSDFDEWLLKAICGHFGVLPSQIGFTPANGLGGSGHQDGEAHSANYIGIRPLVSWLTDLLNQLSYRFLNMPRDLTFVLSEGVEDDEMAMAQRRQVEVQSGFKTLNEVRSEMGLPLYSFPEADTSLAYSGASVIPIPGVASSVESAVKPAPAQPEAEVPAPTPVDGDGEPADEMKAFLKWVKNPRGRDFVFTTVDKATADELNLLARSNPDEARRLVKAGGYPKVGREPLPAKHPARKVSDRLVAIYGPRLNPLHGGVDPEKLAHDWVRAMPQANPAAWLRVSEVRVFDDKTRRILLDLYAEAGWAGRASAKALVGQAKQRLKADSPVQANWDGWQPGDARTAERLMGNGGADYRRMVEDSSATIKGMNDTQVERLGMVLGRSFEAGLSVSDTAAAIRETLDNPLRADLIAHTEMTRAITATAMDEYKDAQVSEVEWQTAGDDGVCPDCSENEAGNPYPIDEAPECPAHPSCGCQLLPAAFDLAAVEQQVAEFEAAAAEGEGESGGLVELPSEHTVQSEAEVLGTSPDIVETAPTTEPQGKDNWVEGKWEKGDLEAHKQGLRDEWASHFDNRDPRSWSDNPPQHSIDTWEKKQAKFEKYLDNIKSIHVNGENIVIDQYGLKPELIQKALNDFDIARRAAEAAGEGGVTLRLMKDSEFNSSVKGASKAHGYCQPIQSRDFGPDLVKPNIYMRGKLYNGKTIIEDYARPGVALSEAQIAKLQSHYSNDVYTTPIGTHVLTHEYGHAIDPYKVDSAHARVSQQLKNETVPVSNYAKENLQEAYAETFAKWVVTRGETLDATVLKYAETFGWKKP